MKLTTEERRANMDRPQSQDRGEMSMRVVALSMAVVLGLAPMAGTVQAGQANGSISGVADRVAKKPYADYSVRARNAALGRISDTVSLDAEGKFSLPNLEVPGTYLLELYDNRHTKVVCAEGPFELAATTGRIGDVVFDCGKSPVGWVLLAAAAAAGVTAVAGVTRPDNSSGIVVNPASASQ